ncbi:XRE family transcriptional regulator [Eubacterium sp. AF17-7]|jgi:transcriptional regulator with XRE-family HTH domain|uniref:helix-turn-helix domain-containing protein n=1 Tax=Eubacterium sp. AF17-7 TaxID=2293105 RepID=UPI000E48C54D|nr:helix-turn-helix transcriptional regulator [Eubacterium sp. AF17-7]RGG63190.1 XRE family transcriptional regulator [Eubacterium sp. AF17-7]
MDNNTNAGSRVRYARELNHFTRDELAEYAGISTKFLYEIENNHKGMSAHTLLNICKALDVSCDYIMTGGRKCTCDQEVITILESFDAAQIPNVKKILSELLELSKY